MHPFLSARRPGYWLAGAGLALSLLLASPAAHAQATTLYNSAGSSLGLFDDAYHLGTFENAGSFVPSAGRLTLTNGDLLLRGTGTIGAGAGTVLLTDASAARTLSLRGETLPNLELNVPLGTTLGSDARLSSSLTLSNGHLLTTAGSKLYLGPTATLNGETNAHYVKGMVQQTKALSGTGAVDFGHMGFTVDPAGQSFALTVERRAGLSQAGVTYGQNPNQAPYKGIDRIWAATSTGSVATPVTLTMSWLSDNDNGLTFAGTNAQVWRSDDNGATWGKEGAVADGSSRTLTVATTRLNALYTISTTAAPLPVTLLSLTATKQGGDGLITWKTASEQNSDYFELQASPDGQAWQVLRQQPAAGTSANTHTYTYLDRNLAHYAAPLVYYRLRQVDLDGKFTFSPVVTLQPDALAAAWKVSAYPNPFARDLTAQLVTSEAGPVQVTLLDASGRLVQQRTLNATPGTLLIALDEGPSMATGTYLLLVHQNGHAGSVRVVHE